MDLRYAFLSGFTLLLLFLISCGPQEPEPVPLPFPQPEPIPEPDLIPPKLEPQQEVTDISCTSTLDCPEGYSCYAELPLGPSAGVKGSPQNPGRCYSNEMASEIY